MPVVAVAMLAACGRTASTAPSDPPLPVVVENAGTCAITTHLTLREASGRTLGGSNRTLDAGAADTVLAPPDSPTLGILEGYVSWSAGQADVSETVSIPGSAAFVACST